jgi:hypothetical protein
MPNSLPLDPGIPNNFMPTQDQHPMFGRSWGLMFRYDYAVVENFSNFTILNWFCPDLLQLRAALDNFKNYTTVAVGNETVFLRTLNNVFNVEALLEAGVSGLNQADGINGTYRYHSCNNEPCSIHGYNATGIRDPTYRYRGLEYDYVLEYALYQSVPHNISATTITFSRPSPSSRAATVQSIANQNQRKLLVYVAFHPPRPGPLTSTATLQPTSFNSLETVTWWVSLD